jgi:PPK2 family polyphosphate:nucleotide phosphotransferase
MSKNSEEAFALQLGRDKKLGFDLEEILVPPGKAIRLAKDFDPGYTASYQNKAETEARVQANIEALVQQQDILYAQGSYALLIIFQALDAAGKDSAIKHVMSGVNPQGCQVTSFKVPSSEELSHDYLWRAHKALPSRGMIGIFNRSYYEEVLVVRVHPELLEKQKLPPNLGGKHCWRERFEQINAFERCLAHNGIIILKFFLNVSKAEQKKRFLERIERAEKNWKFSAADIAERRCWAAYQAAYEDCFNHTSTRWAPWFVIPADHKWFTRLAVSALVVHALKSLKLDYPRPSKEHLRALQEARLRLEKE